MNQENSIKQNKSKEYMLCEIEIFLARCDKYLYEYENAKEHYQNAIYAVKKFVKNGDYKQIKMLITLYIEYLLILYKK